MGTSTTSGDAALNATNSSGTSLLYVRDDGNVGIGTTAPAYLLHVGSPSASGVVAEFQNSSGACTLTPSSSSMTTTCSSDMRLKTDIHDAGDALAWLDDMRIRDFTIRATGEHATGVIAQEMLRTHPAMVVLGPGGYYAVKEPGVWKLVKAIQELKAEHDKLMSVNESLRAEGGYEAAVIHALRIRLDRLVAARRSAQSRG
jgi:Chaperone of endosialidase